MKKFISTTFVIAMCMTAMSCENDSRMSEPENSAREMPFNTARNASAREGDSAISVADTGDEEPRKDKQQWRMQQ